MALLSTEKFIELYKSYKGEVTDVEFAEFLNSKGYRTTQNTKFNDKSVRKRRIDNNIKSKAPLEYGATKTLKSFKDEAKELGIDTKGLTNEEIKNKVRNKRGWLVKKERIQTDPKYAAKKAKASADWAKANPEKVEASQYAYNQRRYLEKGIPPPVKTPKQALWRDLFVTAQNQKVDNRLKLTKKFGKYISLKDFLDAKIIDTKTGKTITFKNLEKYINPKNTGFNYKDVIKPYEQKFFIDKTPGLRNEINSKLIKNWNPGDKRNFFEIQHAAGRYNDPFNVHLSNQNVNLKESQVRTKFETMWNNSKNLSQKKKAFQLYKESLPAGIASQPSMITRTREFGERLPLDEMLRETKAEGVKLPRGILKESIDEVAIAKKINTSPKLKKLLEERVNCAEGCLVKVANEEPGKITRALNSIKNFFVPKPEMPSIKYDDTLGAFVNTGTDDVVSQAGLKAWAKDNPMPVQAGTSVKPGLLRKTGRALAHVGLPLPTAAMDTYFIGRQIEEGRDPVDIAKDPFNWLGLATMEPLTKAAGMADKSGKLASVARLGMSPGMIRGATRFLGLPGLAISTALTAYDQYQKYQDKEGFIYDLFNKVDNTDV